MKYIVKTSLFSLAAVALSTLAANAQTIVIKADKVVTNSKLGTLDAGTLLIEDGVVKAISVNANHEAKELIEGKNYWVTPGIFAAFSTLGLVEVSAESSTNDISASSAHANITLQAEDSFNPKSTSVAISRIGGITHAAIAPRNGKTIFGGIGMLANTSGNISSKLDGSFIYVTLSQGGANTAGGSKSAAFEYLRSALEDAANINTRYKNSATDGNTLSKYEASILSQALKGKIPLVIAADRAVDIANIIKLKRADLKIIIVGAAEGWMVAERLAHANISVIIDPIENLPYSFDALGSRLDNAKLLNDAGVNFAITTRTATGAGAHNLRLITQHAGNAVTNGLSWAEAFKAITLTPAKMFGHSALGSLKAGKNANLVVWDGDPLEVTSTPVAIFIDGKRQSLISRQTQLRDRYNPAILDKPTYGYRP